MRSQRVRHNWATCTFFLHSRQSTLPHPVDLGLVHVTSFGKQKFGHDTGRNLMCLVRLGLALVPLLFSIRRLHCGWPLVQRGYMEEPLTVTLDLAVMSLKSNLVQSSCNQGRKNEIMPSAATWVDLKIIILSEGNQTEKDKHHVITYKQNLKKVIQMNWFTKQKQIHRLRK